MLQNRKNNKTALRLICVFLTVMALLSCFVLCTANAADNESQSNDTIKGVEDIPGKIIGVQLGTTGDEYATEYEGDSAGTKIERYNKAADAIQSLKQQKVDCVVIDEQTAKAFTEKIRILEFLTRNLQRNNMLFVFKRATKNFLTSLIMRLTPLGQTAHYPI